MRLSKLALYSGQTSRSFGIGGFGPHFNGFSLLCHFFLLIEAFDPVSLSLKSEIALVLLSSRDKVCRLFGSASGSCALGSVLIGSYSVDFSAAAWGSPSPMSFSFSPNDDAEEDIVCRNSPEEARTGSRLPKSNGSRGAGPDNYVKLNYLMLLGVGSDYQFVGQTSIERASRKPEEGELSCLCDAGLGDIS